MWRKVIRTQFGSDARGWRVRQSRTPHSLGLQKKTNSDWDMVAFARGWFWVQGCGFSRMIRLRGDFCVSISSSCSPWLDTRMTPWATYSLLV